jgi:hypothetical protein
LKKHEWIISEDINVEHLLDVFTTIDESSDGVWVACINFMGHLRWHKKRPIALKPKIEGLPDNHRSKPECLLELSESFSSVGNYAECKRLLTHALKLQRERGDSRGVAQVLRDLSNANGQMDLPKEGIQQAKEASEIFERFGDKMGEVDCSIDLARLLLHDEQFDAAEADRISCDRSPSGEKRTIPGLRVSSNPWRDMPIHGQDGEGNSPLRGSPWSCIVFQLATRPVLDSLQTGSAVSG